MQNKSPSHSQKKLKQLRLPFQVISKTLPDDEKEEIDLKKRRPSDVNEDTRAVKIVKIDEVNENVKKPLKVDDLPPEIILDDKKMNENFVLPEEEIVNSNSKCISLDHDISAKNSSKPTVKPHKTTKKRKLKVVDSDCETPAPENAVFIIKLPTPSKKRQKKHDKSVVNIDHPTTEKPESTKTIQMVAEGGFAPSKLPIKKVSVQSEGVQTINAGETESKIQDSVKSNENDVQETEKTNFLNELFKTENISVTMAVISDSPNNIPSNANKQTQEEIEPMNPEIVVHSKIIKAELAETELVNNDTNAEFLDQVSSNSNKENEVDAETIKSEVADEKKPEEAKTVDETTDAVSRNNSFCSSSSDEKIESVDLTDNDLVAKGSKKSTKCNTPVCAGKIKPTAITPKQLQRKKEQEQRNLERQRAKEERDRKIQEEKTQRQEKETQRKREREEREEQKRKEREEREEQKRKEKKDRDDKLEQQKKDREEKEEQKRLEREEKERKRLADLEQKNEERKQKEEEKKKRELEAELKKKRASEAFTKFFVAKKNEPRAVSEEESSSCEVTTSDGRLAFMPFQKKGNMRIAPSVRRSLSSNAKSGLDKILLEAVYDKQNLYLRTLQSGKLHARKSERTWQDDDDDVIEVINEMETKKLVESIKPVKKTYRAKFLKFHGNQRPAYYGTWRKKSLLITGRNPFSTDDKLFDYEVDSDDEWEEEEPGESLHGSDDEDKESEDDYEVDNEFMVPHGHLSDEEIVDEDEEDHTPEAQKAKLKILQQEFAAEMKKKTEKLKPTLIGCVWVTSTNDEGEAKCPESCASVIWDLLFTRAMVCTDPIEFVTRKCDTSDEQSTTVAKSAQKRNDLNEEQIKDLIRLIHGNKLSRKFLTKEFNAYYKQKENDHEGFVKVPSKIKQLATWQQCPEVGVMFNKMCWYVPAETRIKYNLPDICLPNNWKYVLDRNPPKPFLNKTMESSEGAPSTTNSTSDLNKFMSESIGEPNKPDIKKFAKVLTVQERQNQFKKVAVTTPTQLKTESKSVSPQHIDLTESDNENETNKMSVVTTPMVWFPSAKISPKPTVTKKRVQLLMTVPRGQPIPEKTKNNLISNFLKTSSTKSVANSSPATSETKSGTASIVVKIEKNINPPMKMDVDDV